MHGAHLMMQSWMRAPDGSLPSKRRASRYPEKSMSRLSSTLELLRRKAGQFPRWSTRVSPKAPRPLISTRFLTWTLSLQPIFKFSALCVALDEHEMVMSVPMSIVRLYFQMSREFGCP